MPKNSWHKQNKMINKEKKGVKTNNKKTKAPIKKKKADEKSANIKKTRSPRKLLTWTILIIMLIGLIIFLCKSEMFNICEIEITGNNQISRQTILKLSEINLQDNIFLSNTIKAKNKISENPYIKEINIKRELPDKIKIQIVEKQKAYMIQIDEEFVYIDKNGSILEISATKEENIIKLEGYFTLKEQIKTGEVLNEEDLERLEDIEKILNSSEKIELQSKISSINIKNKNDYILNLPEYKKIIYIGDTSNLANKMLYAEAILEKALDKEGKIFLNGKLNKGFDPYFREEPNNY